MERFICARRLLAITAILVLSFALGMPSALRESSKDFTGNSASLRLIRSVTGRAWDFSDCAPGCKLLLGAKLLNKRNLRLTTLDGIKLAPLLHNESFTDRMYVWGETAIMAVHRARELGNENITNEFNVEELDKLEGDMIIGRDSADIVLREYDDAIDVNNNVTTEANNSASSGNSRSKRRAVTFDSLLWTDDIRWKFSPNSYSESEKARIREAFRHWEDETCVRFDERPSSERVRGSHIRIVKKSGCWSYIGRQRNGQDLSIAKTCFRLGVIAHEIGHSLGLYHEQSRPDRDKYININYANIRGNPTINFSAKNWRFVRTLGIPYDYSSAMHYGAYDFTRNGFPTISPKDPKMRQVLGQRESLSFLDIKIGNTLYCSEKCGGSSLEWDYCRNGGYRDPNNCGQCKCPKGFAPPSCAGVAPGVNAKCGRQYLFASREEQSFVSPGYPNGYSANSDCAWSIRAPSNHRIRLQFKGPFVIQATRPTCLAYVEIRYKDLTRTGARYCWYNAPRDIIYSHGDEVLILFHTKKSGYRGFNLTYVAEKCGGCSLDSEVEEPVCFKTEKYDCSVDVNAICGTKLCKKKRVNNCYRESTHCCSGYQNNGGKCTRTRPPTVSRRTTTRRPTTTRRTTTRRPRTTRRTTTRRPTTTRRTTTRRPTTIRRTTTRRPTTTRRTTTRRPRTTRRNITRRPSTTSRTTTTTTTIPPTTTTPRTTPPRRRTPDPSYYIWGSWGHWSECSATCGLCGSTVRYRACVRGNCPGPRAEARSCGNRVCPDAPPIRIRRTCDKNGRVCPFPIGLNCAQPQTCFQTIPPLRCCAGKIILNECVLENLKLF